MSKRNLDYQTVKYNGIDLTLAFTVSGKYYPATQYEPEEYPEVEIQEIMVSDSDINIYNLFLDDQIEEIYTLLNEFQTY
jgi:hypothetical protein